MNDKGLKATSSAALALAFASFGDAFLYPFLPVNFNTVGIPVVWVGLLLSINRFVRIISNSLVVHAFAKYGFRTIMICAVLLAIFSTAGYGLVSGLIAWLILRIMWGLSFSAMRIGSLGYALREEKQGFALGVSRSLQEIGPMLSLLIAPFLLVTFESQTIFYLLALCSVPALYFAWSLPREENKTPAPATKTILHWPSVINALTFVSSFLIDGIIVVVLGVLFLRYHSGIDLITATALAAFYLGYRRICLVILAPAGGWIADKIGLDRVFNASMAFVLIGLLAIVSGWITTGAVIVFTFYSMNVAMTAGSVSRKASHLLAAVAENATWRDIGAALGTLIGGFLLSSPYLNTILIMGMISLAFLFFIQLRTARKAFNFLYVWK
jgi:MFS transporter, DHA1 family, multidrug resistance protein